MLLATEYRVIKVEKIDKLEGEQKWILKIYDKQGLFWSKN